MAGDTFADALAAASLSDPHDRSDQPRVRRVASSDPAFNPPGALDRVDTAFAPIVVTESTRMGATALGTAARTTAGDLVSGGCATAREAIIVGGRGAVPLGVERELVALGYREVFRVAGTDRYDTAAQVAGALGTGTPSAAACEDPVGTDGSTRMGYYGNAVAEFRPRLDTCRLLPRAVVLADGGTGADALAAGWWTSHWQVPVLLTAPDGSLPAPTRAALSSLPIDTLIVLGGVVRIPEAVVQEAAALSSSTAGRIAGDDRYETSLAMAQSFGGWWGTGDPDDFAGDRVCLAASSGSGAASTGWPDALAAGPFCARLGAAGIGGPVRVRADATEVGGTAPAHTAVPVILVPAGEGLTEPTRTSLAAAFGPATGFGAVFGGSASVSESAADDLGAAVAQRRPSSSAPTLRDTFATALDLSLVYFQPSGTGPRICQPRGSAPDVRWLSLYADANRVRFVDERDLHRARLLAERTVVPFCHGVGGRSSPVAVFGVAEGGRVGSSVTIDLGSATELSAPIRLEGRISDGGRTGWTAGGAPEAFVDLRSDGRTAPITAATFDLQLSLSSDRVAEGEVSLRAGNTVHVGRAVAEVVRTEGAWDLRGRVDLGFDRAGRPLLGGFRATITELGGDRVEVRWQVDAFPTVRG